ncbi:MAG: MBG domain-containing protein [bacterium]
MHVPSPSLILKRCSFLYLTAGLFLAVATVSVHGQVLESFENVPIGRMPPVGWLKWEEAGGRGWSNSYAGRMPLPGWMSGTNTVPPDPDGGSKMAYVTYTHGGAKTNDLWLITPTLKGLVATSAVSFWYRSSFSNFADNLYVMISTNPAAYRKSDFTIEAEHLSFPRGYPGPAGLPNKDYPEWTNVIVDIGSLVPTGMDIRIGFREYHNNNWYDVRANEMDVVRSDLWSAPVVSTLAVRATSPTIVEVDYYAFPGYPTGNVGICWGPGQPPVLGQDNYVYGAAGTNTIVLTNATDQATHFRVFADHSRGIYYGNDLVVHAGDSDGEGFLFESFENVPIGRMPPPNWLKWEEAGGRGWSNSYAGRMPIPGWMSGTNTVPPDPDGGSKMAYVTYTHGGAKTNDLWLITPTIRNVPSNCPLSFWYRSSFSNFADNLYVMISTNPNAYRKSDFTIEAEHLTFPRGYPGPAGLPNRDYPEWTNVSVNIGSLVPAGTDIRVGFREYHNNNWYDVRANEMDVVRIGRRVRNALAFDGSDDYVVLPLSNSPTAYTIEAWVKPKTAGPMSAFLRTDGNPLVNYSHQLRITGAGNFEHFLWDGTNKTVTGTTVMQTGRWYHIAGTARNGGVMRLFVNGREEGAATSIGTMSTTGREYQVGGGSGGGFNNFDGSIDEVRIWQTERTTNENLDTMNLYVRGADVGLTACYRFDSTWGTNVLDSSEPPFDAFLTGTNTDPQWVEADTPLGDYVAAENWNNRGLWELRQDVDTTHGLNIGSGISGPTNFLVAGHDNATGISPSNLPALFNGTRLERIWYADVHGAATQALDLVFAPSGAGAPDFYVPSADYSLLRRNSKSGAFSTARTGADSISGGGITFSNVSLPEGYVTVALGAPDAPEALSATGVTAHSFFANWNAVTDATNYYLDASTNAGFSSRLAGYDALATRTAVTAGVTGLLPSVTCYYRVRAQYGGATSTNSATIAVNTLSEGAIGFSSGSLSFVCAYASDPQPQNFAITNLGQTAFAHTNLQTYSPATSTWLSVRPATGTVSALGYAAQTATVSVAGLQVGVYYATNTMLSPSATNSPKSIQVSLTVYKATPVITWTNPAPIVHGTPLSEVQLNATAVPSEGVYDYAPPTGTVLNAGSSQPLVLTFTPTAITNYTIGIVTALIDVAKADQTITFDPIPDQETTNYYQLTATAASGLDVSFAVAWGPASISGNTNLSFTGAGGVGIYASQAGDTNWNNAPPVTNTFNVTKATALVTLSNLLQVYDGTPRVVDATTAPTGLVVNLTYNGMAGPPTNAGLYAVTGTVNDVMYQGLSADTLEIYKATPVITWTNPSPIVYGATLSDVQLNATAVPSEGVYDYAPPTGTVLNAGSSQPLVLTFTPTAITNYTIGIATARIDVAKADQTIAFAPIPDQETTNYYQLTATAASGLDVSFAVAWGPASISGNTNLSFTGAGGVGIYASQAGDTNWNRAPLVTNTFNVTKATASVTLSNLLQVYDGTPRFVAATTAPTGLVINLTYNGMAAPPTNAGLYAVTGTVNDVMYQGLTTDTLEIYRATPVITWANPSPIVYGAALSEVQLNATVDVAGVFAYAPSTGTVLHAGTNMLSVDFTPSDTLNYSNAAATAQLVVDRATTVITWTNPAPITYGTPLSELQLNASAIPPEGTYDYAPPTGTVLNAGASQALVVTFTPTAITNYTIGMTTTFIDVAKADQTIAFDPIPDQRITNNHQLTAGASSGLDVNFAVASGPASISGNTNLSFTGVGDVSIVASQGGNTNWNVAPDVTNTFKVYAVIWVSDPVTNGVYDAAYRYDLYAYDRQAGRAVTYSGTGLPAWLSITNLDLITTVAGTGTDGYSGDGGAATNARLNFAANVAVGPSNTWVIADTANNRIRNVDAQGVITTVAGNGSFGYSGDGAAATNAMLGLPNGVAMDEAGNVYISDTENHRVRKVDTSGIITTIAGTGTAGDTGDGGAATNAQLNFPKSVAVDGIGNVYVADSENNRIRKVDTNGVITTLAGNGIYDFGGDGGPATNASLQAPTSVAPDQDGNVYIADRYNNRIRKVDDGGIITTVAGNGSFGYSGDGGAATNAALNYPSAVAVDWMGRIYFSDTENARIRRVDTNGIINALAGNGNFGYSGDGGPALDARLDSPNGVAVDSYGRVYVADYYNMRIRQVSPTAGILSGTPAAAGSYDLMLWASDGNSSNAQSFQLVIAKAPATVTLGNLSQTYDGTARSVTVTTDPSGLTVTVTYDGNTWVPTNAGTYAVTGTVSEANFQGATAGELTIAAKELTVTGAVAQNKVYDGNDVATITGATLVGVVGAEDVVLANATTGTFAQVGMGTNIAVATAPMTITGADIGNYTLTQPTGLNADITAKELTVTGAVAQNKVYDGNAVATITGATLIGVVGAEDVVLANATTGTFAQVGFGTNLAVVTAPMTITGADIGNYTLTQPTGLNADITAKELTVTGAVAQNKVYDGNAVATITGATLIGVVGAEDVVMANATTGTFAQVGIGTDLAVATAPMTITGDDIGNYTLTQPTGLNADITAKELTVTGAVAEDKVYDGNAVATITGATLVGVVGTQNVVLANATTGTFAQVGMGTNIDVATAPMTITGADIGNYTLTQPTGLQANISAKELTVTGALAEDKVYDGNAVATITGATLVGVVGTQNVVLANATTGTFAQVGMGTNLAVATAPMTITGSDIGTYTLTQPAGLNADITAKELTVTGAVAEDKVYDGNAVATITGATLSGVVGAEDVVLANATTGTFAQVSVGTNLAVATAPMTITGADIGNYTLTQPTGLNADITKADQTIAFPAIPDQLTTNNYQLAASAGSGLAVSFAVGGGPASIAGGTNLSFTGAGEVSIAASQAGDGNWNAAPDVTNTFDVTKALASVTLTNLTQTYDGTARVVGFESVPSGLSVLLTYDGNAWAPTNAGDYAVTGMVNEAMYQGVATGSLEVAKDTSGVYLFDLSHVYDGTAKAASVTTTPAGLTVDITYDGNATEPTNAGSYAVTGTVDDANWQGEAVDTLTIQPAAASVYLQNLSQTYDGTARSVTATTDPSGLTVEITYDGSSTAPVNVGTYAVTGRIDEVNYTGVVVDVLSVSKATQTVAFVSPISPVAQTGTWTVAATASSSLLVTNFSVLNGPGEVVGDQLTFTNAGYVTLSAVQEGDGNWLAAGATMGLYVAGVPVWVSTPVTTGVCLQPYLYALEATDADSPAVFYSAESLPDWLSLTTFTNDRIIRTLAGTGIAGYNGDDQPALDAQLKYPAGLFRDTFGLYIADQYNHRVRYIDPFGTMETLAGDGTAGTGGDGGAATNAQLRYPTAVARDATGNLYLADRDNNRVRKVDTNGVITTLAGTGVAGYFGDGGAATNARLRFPSGLALDSNGNVYLADRDNNRVRKVDTNGLITTFAGTGLAGYLGDGSAATNARLRNPVGLAYDAVAGILYIADQNNHAVRSVEAGVIATVAGTGSSGFNGNEIAATNAMLNKPAGVGLDADGNLYIADTDNHQIRWLDDAGIIHSLAGLTNSGFSGDGGPATNAQLYAPFSVVVDDSGVVALSDYNNQRLRTIGLPPVGLTGTPPTGGVYEITLWASDGVHSNEQAFTVTVSKVQAQVYLGNLSQIYDGTARNASATTMPAGLTVEFTYDGNAWAPTNAGTYRVTGTVNEVNYAGEGTDDLTISKADQAIDFDPIGTQVESNRLGLAATADSGLSVSFATNSGPALIADSTNLSFTGHGVVSIVAGQAGDANWNAAPDVTNTFTVLELFDVTIQSPHGTATPGPGTRTYVEGMEITNRVTGLDTGDTTQFVCVGWAMAGNDPVSGGGLSVTMTVTNDATLTWLWTTNYWLETAAGLHGSVNVGEGWQAFGVTTSITATAEPYYHFTNWTGDAAGDASPLNLVMDAPKAVMANFAANWTTNQPTPEWWLASYGITDRFEEVVMEDPDGDRIPTGDEFVMHTDPTNARSFLQVSQVGPVFGTNCFDRIHTNDVPPYDVQTQRVCDVIGNLLVWPCATDRVYDVQYEDALPALGWVPLEGMTNLMLDSTELVLTNLFDGSQQQFFRLGVRVPQ